jgi:hypothetical protein
MARRDNFREWSKTASFQIVVVPSLLALVGIVFVDICNKPWVAFGVIILVAVVATVVFFVRRKRTRYPLVYESPHAPYDGLVFSMSVQKDPVWFKTLLETQKSSWNPTSVVCLVSEAARAAGGLSVVEEVFGPVSVHTVSGGLELKPMEMASICKLAIKALNSSGDVLVDVTGGNAVMSIGLYEAAVENEASVGYIAAENKNLKPILLINARSDGPSST